MRDECGETHGLQPVNGDSYEIARSWLSTLVSRREDVRSLYEYGTVRAPGVSDIDIIVVLADRTDVGIAGFLEVASFPAVVRELIDDGNMMIMRSREFSEIRIWDDVSLIRLAGESLPLVDPPPDVASYLELCRVIDWLPERIARLMAVPDPPAFPERRVLRLLNSLIYSLQRLQNIIGEESAEMARFERAVHASRQKARADASGLVEEVRELWLTGVNLAFKAVYSLGSYMLRTGLYSNDNQPIRGELSLGTILTLSFSDVGIDSARDMSWRERSQGKVVAVVPAVIYQHYAVYASFGGPIGKAIGQNMSPVPLPATNGRIATPLRDVMKLRMDHCNRMASFLSANGFSGGLYKFGWFYPFCTDDDDESAAVAELDQ